MPSRLTDNTARPGQAGLVSVLIGTYNAAPYIAQTLDSVLAQTYSPIEVIVVDDGSTDETWAVLQSYGERIVAIRQPNGGVAAARNTGLRHARGEFIALMDHDDLCMPERIAVQVALLRRCPEIGLCGTEFSGFDDKKPLAEVYSPFYYSQCDRAQGLPAGHFAKTVELDVGPALATPSAQPVIAPVYTGRVYDAMACGNFIHPPTVLFLASLLVSVGEFDLSSQMMCDWEWLVRVAKVTAFGYIDRPLLNYRRSSTQISSERHRKSARLDTVQVAERIVEQDPELWQRCGKTLRPHLAGLNLDAAFANAETNPRLSLKLLAKVLFRYRWFDRYALQVLIKALTPNHVLALVRNARGNTQRP